MSDRRWTNSSSGAIPQLPHCGAILKVPAERQIDQLLTHIQLYTSGSEKVSWVFQLENVESVPAERFYWFSKIGDSVTIIGIFS